MYHTVKSGAVAIIIISVQNRGCVGPQYHVNHELMLSVRRKDKNSIRWVEDRTVNAQCPGHILEPSARYGPSSRRYLALTETLI